MAPDSKAFFVNGATSAYSGIFVTVYVVSRDDVKALRIGQAAQADLVVTFPPCKAFNRDEAEYEPAPSRDG